MGLYNNTAETERLLTENYERYYRLAFKLMRNQDDALDVVQESAYRAIKDCKGVRNKDYLSTWIYRIAYNTAVSETRRRKREWACIDQARLANLPDSEAERMDAWEGRQEYLDALARAVGELEPEERALVTLFYYEEYSVSECAGITQMSESNIKVRLHRIRKKLYILVNTQLHGSEK